MGGFINWQKWFIVLNWLSSILDVIISYERQSVLLIVNGADNKLEEKSILFAH